MTDTHSPQSDSSSQPTFNLSEEQQSAIDLAEEWYELCTDFTDEEPPDEPIFRLAGFAGTGKTTTIKALIAQLKVRALFAAFTGKAALVMRQNSGVPARTIHSLIYKPVPPDKKACDELFDKIKETENVEEKKKLKAELKEKQKVHFELNEESDLCKTELLVLDECSMVNDEMLKDLLSFNVPIIALGDPGQLPPVEGTGALFKEKPNITLTQIHRQAADNPIIAMSVRARNGVHIPEESEGAARNFVKAKLGYEGFIKEVEAADQILVGKNATRREVNQTVRNLRDFNKGRYPVPGEKIICLRNDASKGLFNGMMAEVIEQGELYDSSIELLIRTELQDESAEPLKVQALLAYFDEYYVPKTLENVKWWERQDTQEFDFGYAITVHKSQGSQWNNVLLLDDKFLVWKPRDRCKWLYTAITRAAETFTRIG